LGLEELLSAFRMCEAAAVLLLGAGAVANDSSAKSAGHSLLPLQCGWPSPWYHCPAADVWKDQTHIS